MSLASLFTPEVIKTFHSDYNGELKLYKFVGELRLDSDGLTQSGSVMVWIWSQAVFHLLPKDFSPKNILLLGLGGGSALFWLRRHFPKSHLTVVEIDPVMIDIAKDYFKIDRIPNLNIIHADAVEYIKNTPQQFSLILVDCYRGFVTPPQFADIKILKRMKSIGDRILINRLYWDEHKLRADEFVSQLAPHFSVTSVYTASNLVISLN